ncbi:MAG: hypothetical protein AAGG50_01520 [Bacteroidota bacterium]
MEGYPAPLVAWAASSKAMKADYYAIKRRPETKALANAVYARHGSPCSPSSWTWKSNGAKSKRPRSKPSAMKPPKQPGPVPLFDQDGR